MIELSANRADGKYTCQAIAKYDVMSVMVTLRCSPHSTSQLRWRSVILVMDSQEAYYKELDMIVPKVASATTDHAYNKDGGLAVLYGNIARNGCIVKTAGVDPSVYHFKGTAKVCPLMQETPAMEPWQQSPGRVM